MRRPLKTTLIFILGFVLGGIVVYGYQWYQVYHKINTVFYCQVFTGKLSVEQAEHCEKYNNERTN